MSAPGLLTRLLSPLTLSGLQTDHESLREGEVDAAAEDVHIETHTIYICPDCDQDYEFHDEAVDCCADERRHNSIRKAGNGCHCPVCDAWCADSHGAANCCLWKDLTAGSRFLIANAHETGADWLDAIAAHGVKA